MALEPIKKRDIFLCAEISKDNIKDIITEIKKIENSDEEIRDYVKDVYKGIYQAEPINLYLDSYGGSVYAAISLYNIIRNCKTEIHITVLSTCFSACNIILMASKFRKCYDNSRFLIHSVSSITYGKLEQMKADIKETDYLQNNIVNNIICSNSKLTKAKLKAICESGDFYFNSDKALEIGFVNEIINL